MSPAIAANATPENSSTESAQTQSAQAQGTEANQSLQTSQTPGTSAPASPANGENKPVTQTPVASNPASASKETATPASGDAAKTGATSKETNGKVQTENKAAQPQTPSAQSAPQPAAQGDEPAVSCGTLKGCFPDPVFRAYLVKFIDTTQYPNPDHRTAWNLPSGANMAYADDMPVTQSWLDSVTDISSDKISTPVDTLSTTITDLTGIDLFRNLKTFSNTNNIPDDQYNGIGFTQLKNYTPLATAHFANLQSVKISNLTNATAQTCRGFSQANDPNLTDLYLRGMSANITSPNQFSDLSPFYGLSGVKTMTLVDTTVGMGGKKDIQGLVDHFPNVDNLWFRDATGLKDVPEHHTRGFLLPLKNLQHLKTFGFSGLWLYQNPILNDITQLSQIDNLNLSSNSISDLNFLKGMTNLRGLQLGGNDITDLRPLSSLANTLESLNVTGEQPFVATNPIIGADGTLTIDYKDTYNIDGSAPQLTSLMYLDPYHTAISPYTNDTVNRVITIPNINASIPGMYDPGVGYNMASPITYNGKTLGQFEVERVTAFHNPQVTFNFRGGLTHDGRLSTFPAQSAKYGQNLEELGVHPWMFTTGPDGQPKRDETNNLFKGWVGCPTDKKLNPDYDFTRDPSSDQFIDQCTFDKAEPFDYTGTPMTKDWTLFALWTSDAYDVTFDSQAGGPDVKTQHVARFDKATPPKDSAGNDLVYTDSKGGTHALLGWYTPDGTKYDFNQQVKAPIALHAKWDGIKNVYKVKYLSDSGTQISSENVYEGDKAAGVPNPGTRDGYKFDGWFEDHATAPFDFGTTAITRNVTVTEHWTPVPKTTYTVSFDANGGTLADGTTNPENIEKGKFATKPANDPTLAGSTFAGWYTKADGGEKFDFDTTAITANTTLYAHWTQNQNNGGGSNNGGGNNNNGGGNNNGGNNNGGSGNNNGGGSNNNNNSGSNTNGNNGNSGNNGNGNNTNGNGGNGTNPAPSPVGPAGPAFTPNPGTLGNPGARMLTVIRNRYIGVAPNAAANPTPAQQQNDQNQDNSSANKQTGKKKQSVPVCPQGYVLQQSSYFENTTGTVEMAKINPKCVLANQASTQTKSHHSFMWLWWLLLLLVLVLVAMYAYHRYEKNKEENEQPAGSQHIAY